LATWVVLEWVIAESGFAQELLEGIVALIAAAVLFYVSYWLISKSQAQAWQRYLAHRVEEGVIHGSGWSLGATAFLAVYREGAETILMLRPIVGGGGWLTVVGALLVGGVLLAGVFWAFRYAGMRLPLRSFFSVTGVMLFALAVIFAGKGTAELQEAGIVRITPLVWMPTVPDLGLFPTLQTVLIQLVLVIGAVAAGALLWLSSREWSSKSILPEGEGAQT
jgi:high-affinity iron transporter